MTHALVARLDRLGDVLVCSPAVRAVAASCERVTVMTSPAGAEAARLLPGVDDVLVWDCPWIGAPPAPVDRDDVERMIDRLAAAAVDRALILTSFHQSALPTALLLRMAGVPVVAGVSTDYPGDLLSERLADPPEAAEPLRMLAVAEAAGYRLPDGDDRRLVVRLPAAPSAGTPEPPYVVVHPGVDAPARAYPRECWQAAVAELTATGRTLVVTGSRAESELAAAVTAAAERPGRAYDLCGATD